ncbi:uncharacterized protein LOC127899937 [Citrus sinensis]|uniref:uncharacterized protein LOC127899937 n=1 Tax=Citrus sinensis TaxID=2711 RepID=UPI0022793D0A|nr:uncharacterized protein LOC127899937 [Citrus sinensis]
MANNEKNTALHEAVCHGNVQVVKILMKQDPDYSYSPNNFGKTPLYMAVEGRYSEMVIELLENCTSVSYEGPKGKTALHAAAMHFYFGGITTYDCARQISGLQLRKLDKAAFQKLLEKKEGLIQKTDYYGWTPIHYAAYHDQYQQIRVLLEIDQTASNIADKDRKMTALHLAAGQGHARTRMEFQDLKNLLKNPLARSLIDEGDANGNTPLHVLAAIHRKEFFKIKVRYDTGGNYGAVNNKNVSVIDVLIYGSCELKEDVRNLSRDNGRGQYSDGIICKRALLP